MTTLACLVFVATQRLTAVVIAYVVLLAVSRAA